MPYYTGTANSSGDLRQAIVNAGTLNGWAWDSVNQMLYKGDIYVKLTTSGNKLMAQCATGYSGGTLTNPSPVVSGFSDFLNTNGNTPLSYPADYHIFIHSSPDDIICALNYQTAWWQWLMFGQAANLGVSGKCIWHFGSLGNYTYTPYGVAANVSGQLFPNDGDSSGIPFWPSPYHPSGASKKFSAIHVDIDGSQWATNGGYGSFSAPSPAHVIYTVPSIIARQPNAWNGDAILAPMIVHCRRASNLESLVADLTHLRMLRNDYLSDGQIITIGSDKWFCAPAYRKNTTNRDVPASSNNHSGTIGIAVRYDGP